MLETPDIIGAKGGKAGGVQGFRAPIEDPNTLISITTARVIVMIGEGPNEGIVGGPQTGTVATTSGSPSAHVTLSPSMPDDTYVVNTKILTSQNGAVVFDGQSGVPVIVWVRNKTVDGFDILIAEEESGETGVPKNDFIEISGENVQWSATGAFKSMHLNEVPAQGGDKGTSTLGDHRSAQRQFDDSVGTFNSNGITFEERKGTFGQTPIPGFPEIENEVSVGLEATNDGVTPVKPVKRITDSDVDAVRVKLLIPQLSHQDTTTGDLLFHTVTVAWEILTNGTGDWDEVRRETITGKNLSPFIQSWRLELPPGSFWDIRLVRISLDSDTAADVNPTFFSSLTELIDVRITYSNTAVLGVAIDSEQFGTRVPKMAFDYKGRILKIPDNYDPITRVYDGIWSGAFKFAWSDNPAWVMYDMLTNKRYGLGRDIDEDAVDKFGLYTIAQYCDGLVPDGAGGLIPRYTFNGILNTKMPAYSMINMIASNFRAMPYWAAGQIVITQDAPADPTRSVSNSNVEDGLFIYESGALKDRHSVIKTSYIDPEDNYRPGIDYAEDQDMIRRFGIRDVQIIAPYVIERANAHRFGLRILDDERFSSQVVRYRTGLDMALMRPGEIFEVNDSEFQGARVSGRIKSVAGGTSIEIEQAVSLVAGESYTLVATLPDGTREVESITNSLPGSYATLTIASAFSTDPLVGAHWHIQSSALAPREFRCITIREDDDHLFQITGTLHDSTKYARIEQDIRLPVTNPTLLPTGPISNCVENLNVSIIQVTNPNGATQQNAFASWTPHSDPRVTLYEARYRLPPSLSGGVSPWVTLGVNASTNRTIENIVAIPSNGSYRFEVRPMDGLGAVGPWCGYDFTPIVETVPDVVSLGCAVQGDTLTLQWPIVAYALLSHYEIRFVDKTSGAVWNSGIIIGQPNATPNVTFETFNVPAIAGTYFIKAVDIFGHKSQIAAECVELSDGITVFVDVVTITESIDYPGTHSDTHVDASDDLVLNGAEVMSDWGILSGVPLIGDPDPSVASSGTYTFGRDPIDLGAIYQARVVPDITALAERIDVFIAAWQSLAIIGFMTGVGEEETGFELQFRTTTDDPTGSPSWTDWNRFILGLHTFWGIEFRIVLTSTNVNATPSVSLLAATAAVAERTEAGAIASTNAGSVNSVTYGAAFYAIPNPIVQIDNPSTGDYVTITNKSKTGFDLRVFNSGDTGVSRSISWSVQGHGALIP